MTRLRRKFVHKGDFLNILEISYVLVPEACCGISRLPNSRIRILDNAIA